MNAVGYNILKFKFKRSFHSSARNDEDKAIKKI